MSETEEISAFRTLDVSARVREVRERDQDKVLERSRELNDALREHGASFTKERPGWLRNLETPNSPGFNFFYDPNWERVEKVLQGKLDVKKASLETPLDARWHLINILDVLFNGLFRDAQVDSDKMAEWGRLFMKVQNAHDKMNRSQTWYPIHVVLFYVQDDLENLAKQSAQAVRYYLKSPEMATEKVLEKMGLTAPESPDPLSSAALIARNRPSPSHRASSISPTAPNLAGHTGTRETVRKHWKKWFKRDPKSRQGGPSSPMNSLSRATHLSLRQRVVYNV